MNIGIYKISNIIDDRIYIGSSKNIESRFKSHLWELKSEKHKNPHLMNFVKKYGKETIIFEIIENCTISQLEERENYYFDLLKPSFNICKRAYRFNSKRNFTEEQIKEYAELYNSGKSLRWIAINILGNEKYRYTFNDIKNGKLYPEFSHLFIKRKYDQKGRIVSEETKNKFRGKTFTGKLKELDVLNIIERINNCESMMVISKDYNVDESLISLIKRGKSYPYLSHLITNKKRHYNMLSDDEIIFIKNNYKKMFIKDIAINIKRHKTTVYRYIKTNLK